MTSRLLYIAICLIASTIYSVAQSPKADSLLSVLEQTNSEKEKAAVYYQLVKETIPTDITKATLYAEQAIKMAKGAATLQELCDYYLLLAFLYETGGHIEASLEAARSALLLSRELDNKRDEYYASSSISNAFRRMAKFDSTFNYIMNCLRVAEQLQNDTLVANAYNSLGSYYATVGNVNKAEDYHLKALEVRTKQKDSIAMAFSYNNLGIMNRMKGDMEKALEYYYKARDIYVWMNDSSEIAFIYNDIGAAYSKEGNTDSGEYYLKRSIDIRERMNELNELAYTYNFLGENYERKGNLKKAEEYIKKALNLAIEIKNNKQNYEAYESLSDFFARNKMYDSAYKYLQLYRFFRDSIRQLDNNKLIAELNTKYETEKKDKKIQEQEFELASKNYMLGGAALFLLLGTLLGFSSYRRYRLKQQTKLQQEILKQQEIATKAVLEAEEGERQRIAGDLHDGVGQMMSAAKINLSSISDSIPFSDEKQKERFENALKLVDDSCTEVRTVSHNIMPNSLLRRSLGDAVRSFISKISEDVIKINLYSEGLNEKIDENIEIVLYRVVQECVNNVIKHANANTLDISLIKDGDEITVTIEDNGKGFDTKDTSKYEGVGMKNILTRVNYLKGTVEWDSALGRGTVVSISIPME